MPFVIYFAANNALYDALYGTILFNVKYAVNGSFHNDTAHYLFFCAVTFFPLFLMLVASGFELVINRKNKFAWCTLFLAVMPLIMLLNLRSYEYYSMINVPVLPMMFAILGDALKDFWQGLKRLWRVPGFSFKRTVCKFLLIILVPTSLFYTGYCLRIYLLKFDVASSEVVVVWEENFQKRRAQVEELAKIIPDDEKKSFVTWRGGVNTSVWCLITDMKPRCRFFNNQSALSIMDPIVRQEWFDNVTKDYPLWILYGGKLKRESRFILTTPEDADVKKLLAEKYICKGEVDFGLQTLKLYRLKQ